jgi:DNA replication protein DnaC
MKLARFKNNLDGDRPRIARRMREARAMANSTDVGGVYSHCFFRTYRPCTDSQMAAYRAVRAFWDGSPWSLVLAGGPGVGKSHLLVSHFRLLMRSQVAELRSGWAGGFGPVPDPCGVFTTETAAEMRWRMAGNFPGQCTETRADVLWGWIASPVVYLDDLGMVSPGADAWHSVMNQVLTERHRHRRLTMISTNLSSDDIAGLYGKHGSRIVSRLASGICVRMDGEDGRREAC